MTPRRLVVVPYYYPPFPGSGNRWPAMARHLRRAGHKVTIFATGAYGRLPDDHEMDVVRVGDLASIRSLRRVLRRGDLIVAGGEGHTTSSSALLTKVLVPDSYAVSWLPAALVAVRRHLARHEVDCLVTSTPPESNHLLGLLLGSRRPAWLADFRDGWRFEPLREPFPTAAQRALDAWLERRVAHTADVVVGATRPIAEDLERRLGARAAYVPNGWDAEAAVDSPADARNSSGEGVMLVYTGTLSGIRGSDPTPLLRALSTVLAEPELPRIRVVLAGRLTAAERALIESCGVGDAVEHLGVLDRSAALALQRSADALILLTSRNSSEATGKIFEYLGAGRPIVALAENNEAERIVRETNTGVTVPPDDVGAIATALRRVATGELAAAYAPRNLEQFTYPRPADAMAEAVENAIRRRSLSQTSRDGM
jgi:glycosyltransferase involved in cell wall biosynthesis